jgi:dTDP-4-amino-4,6-dideoxygalactose transaminase
MTALPALLGGPPLRPQGPPPWPLPDEEVFAALQAAFQSGTWGVYHGPHVPRLEEELARYHGVSHALTCASGTLAVEAGLRALGVGPGDEVILAAYDYGGNFLGVHAIGAKPVLVDVSATDWNLAPAHLTTALSPTIRAILVSHLHGGVVPMAEVMAKAAAHKISVLEDAAQMPGAMIQGKRAGTWGDVGVLSFGGSKLLSAGRGGALLTRHAEVHQRAKVWLNRGNNSLSPLSELQAAVLLPQLAKLDERNRQRTANVETLKKRLAHVPGLRPFNPQTPDAQPGYYKLGWQYDPAAFGLSRERFIAAVRAEGIAFDEGFRALHVGRSPSRFRQAGPLTEADKAHRQTVILHHPVLLGSDSDVEEVAAAVEKVYANVKPLSGT